MQRSVARRIFVSSSGRVITLTTSTVRASFMRISSGPIGRTRRSARSISAAAKTAPGVVAVFTGADMAADNVGGLPCGWQIHNKDGSPMIEPPHPVLAVGKVRHVGDPVVVVIATTKQAAKDAAELLAIDYQDLPAVGVTGRRGQAGCRAGA